LQALQHVDTLGLAAATQSFLRAFCGSDGTLRIFTIAQRRRTDQLLGRGVHTLHDLATLYRHKRSVDVGLVDFPRLFFVLHDFPLFDFRRTNRHP